MIPLMPKFTLSHTRTLDTQREEIIYNNKNKCEENLKIHFVHNSLSLDVVPLSKIW